MKPIKIDIPEEPGDALAAVVALRVLADQVERTAVRNAFAQGWTWAQIAEGLGVTRQAAHKRHAGALAQEAAAHAKETTHVASIQEPIEGRADD